MVFLNVLLPNAHILILLLNLNLQLALSNIYFDIPLSHSVNLRGISVKYFLSRGANHTQTSVIPGSLSSSGDMSELIDTGDGNPAPQATGGSFCKERTHCPAHSFQFSLFRFAFN